MTSLYRHLALLISMAASVLPSTIAIAADGVEGEPVARVIIALYDGRYDSQTRASNLHLLADMPLNHLGLTLRFHDATLGLPDIATDPHVRGVLTWLSSPLPDKLNYLDWLEEVLAAGKRLVIFGAVGAPEDLPMRRINETLRPLGMRFDERFVNATYNATVLHKAAGLVEYERPLRAPFPPYPVVKVDPDTGKALLTLRKGNRESLDSSLIVLGPQGGFVASGYTHFGEQHLGWVQWYIDPFAFFRAAFATDDVPKPDTTTLSGRRMYYSHIDGDGWRNLTELEEYRGLKVTSAEVVMRKAIMPYPDLPVTVAPVTADLDPKWYGSQADLELARELLALAQVEAGTHTHTHPFQWSFFEDYTAAKEAPFLPHYADLEKELEQTMELYARGAGGVRNTQSESQDFTDIGVYSVPRAYAKQPFALEQEVAGSIGFVNALLPAGKRVEVLQWSGDTAPFPAALGALKSAKVRNINGGDARMDPDFPSLGWVSALGFESGPYRQVYASNSNENTYTHLWRDRFYGFQFLKATAENTETPRRLKPINVYYHMYSGQKPASLQALVRNLDYARTQDLTPVSTSRFAGIVEGFFSARIVKLGEHRWQIHDRDLLQTLRFDASTDKQVDFARSHGVLGARRVGESLYVALDEAVDAPVVALDERSTESAPSSSGPKRPLLIEARWRVYDLKGDANTFSFQAQGFGEGEIVWQVVPNTAYAITRLAHGEVAADSTKPLIIRSDVSGALRVPAKAEPDRRVDFEIERAEDGN